MGEKHQYVVALHPLLGTWPATQACALPGNRSGDPLVLRPMLNPLRHTSQGYILYVRLSGNLRVLFTTILTLKKCINCSKG